MSTLCLGCGKPTSAPGGRHAECPTQRRLKAGEVYRDVRWKRTRRIVMERHLRRWGYTCLGDEALGHERHVADPKRNPLTVDHIIPVVTLQQTGGDPFDQRNLQVVCRSLNSAKDAALGGLGRKAGL